MQAMQAMHKSASHEIYHNLSQEYKSSGICCGALAVSKQIKQREQQLQSLVPMQQI